MRKILIMLALAAVFIIQMTPASAKEVFVGSKYGLDFYVETSSIDVIFSSKFYVEVNEYSGDTLEEVNEWKFYFENFGRADDEWHFDYEYLGTNIPVSSSELAAKILRACQIHNAQISS